MTGKKLNKTKKNTSENSLKRGVSNFTIINLFVKFNLRKIMLNFLLFFFTQWVIHAKTCK